jgi:Fur family ferric uptake transcriptional regulator
MLIAEASQRLEGAFTVDELAAEARSRYPGVGLATVYRAVAAMAEAGWLQRVGARNTAALWARCDSDEHHHHLVCTGCGTVMHVPCTIAEQTERLAAEEGFVVTAHEVRMYGTCARCRTG